MKKLINLTKKPTSITLDPAIKQQAKAAGINISRFCEEALLEFLTAKEVYEDTVPALLSDEIEKFIEVAGDNQHWRNFAPARSILIKNKTGIVIIPKKLIMLVERELDKRGLNES